MCTKKLRYLTHNAVYETVLIFFFGYGAYVNSEILHLSGVISILVSGIIMAHYMTYNISETGKITTG